MAILYGDILLKDDSIYSKSGDLATGDNKEQAVGAIVRADYGNFRNNPTMAAGLTSFLAGPMNSRNIAAAVQNALYLDGWKLNDMNIDSDLEDIEVTVQDAEKTTDETSSLV